jgi:hypothetical protein
VRAFFPGLHLFQMAEKEEQANGGGNGESDQAIHEGLF